MTERLVVHVETPSGDWYRLGSAGPDEPAALISPGGDAVGFAEDFNVIATAEQLRLTPAVVRIGGVTTRFTYFPAD